MKVQELPMRAFYAHLRRHPIPEIIDEACLTAIGNVEKQYGVRLPLAPERTEALRPACKLCKFVSEFTKLLY